MVTLRGRLRALLGAIDILDILLVAGLGLLAYGLSLLHPALPFVAIGGLMVAAWAGVGSPRTG